MCFHDHMTYWFYTQVSFREGYELRRTTFNKSARLTYDRLMNRDSLLWIAIMCGVDDDTVKKAYLAGKNAGSRALQKCNAIRQVIPFDMLYACGKEKIKLLFSPGGAYYRVRLSDITRQYQLNDLYDANGQPKELDANMLPSGETSVDESREFELPWWSVKAVDTETPHIFFNPTFGNATIVTRKPHIDKRNAQLIVNAKWDSVFFELREQNKYTGFWGFNRAAKLVMQDKSSSMKMDVDVGQTLFVYRYEYVDGKLSAKTKKVLEQLQSLKGTIDATVDEKKLGYTTIKIEQMDKFARMLKKCIPVWEAYAAKVYAEKRADMLARIIQSVRDGKQYACVPLQKKDVNATFRKEHPGCLLLEQGASAQDDECIQLLRAQAIAQGMDEAAWKLRRVVMLPADQLPVEYAFALYDNPHAAEDAAVRYNGTAMTEPANDAEKELLQQCRQLWAGQHPDGGSSPRFLAYTETSNQPDDSFIAAPAAWFQ